MTENEPYRAPLLEGPLCKPGGSQRTIDEAEDEIGVVADATSLEVMQAIYRNPSQPV
jgi:hypothetical protein